MSIPRTETTDMSSWQQAGWEIASSNATYQVISTPNIPDLQLIEVQDLLIQGDLVIAAPSNVRIMDRTTHENLLEQSFREYDDIWRILAKE